MAARLAGAAVLVATGLGLLAFADLPPGLLGTPFRHVPVQARVTERTADEQRRGDDTVRLTRLSYRYVFEGRSYDGSYMAPDGHALPSSNRRMGEVRTGDVIEIFLDPERPAFESPRRDQRLGHDRLQVILGAALAIAGIATAIAAVFRPRR